MRARCAQRRSHTHRRVAQVEGAHEEAHILRTRAAAVSHPTSAAQCAGTHTRQLACDGSTASTSLATQVVQAAGGATVRRHRGHTSARSSPAPFRSVCCRFLATSAARRAHRQTHLQPSFARACRLAMGNAASAPGPSDRSAAQQQGQRPGTRPAYAPQPYAPTPYFPQVRGPLVALASPKEKAQPGPVSGHATHAHAPALSVSRCACHGTPVADAPDSAPPRHFSQTNSTCTLRKAFRAQEASPPTAPCSAPTRPRWRHTPSTRRCVPASRSGVRPARREGALVVVAYGARVLGKLFPCAPSTLAPDPHACRPPCLGPRLVSSRRRVRRSRRSGRTRFATT